MELITTNGILTEADVQKAKDIFEEGTSKNTVEAYRRDVNYFFTWAELVVGGNPLVLPIKPDLVVKFITDHVTGLDPQVDTSLVAMKIKGRLGPYSVTTVSRRVSALSVLHRMKGFEHVNPCKQPHVSQLLSKARKRAVKQGVNPKKKKAATLDKLDAMIATCDDSLAGLRTKAMFYFAFSSGGRRASEVATARLQDLTCHGDDYTYLIPHSKTDQEGKGHVVPICGVAADALREWIKAADITEGKIFRGITRHGRITDSLTRQSVTRLVKQHAELAGLNPKDFSSHSMRSGYMTEAGNQKHELKDIMGLSGHKTVDVAMGYMQTKTALKNPTNKLAG